MGILAILVNSYFPEQSLINYLKKNRFTYQTNTNLNHILIPCYGYSIPKLYAILINNNVQPIAIQFLRDIGVVRQISDIIEWEFFNDE